MNVTVAIHRTPTEMIVIAQSARVSERADIEDSVRGSTIAIEDGVMIDAFVKIKPVGGSGNVRIGRNSQINSGCVIYSGNGIDIGRSAGCRQLHVCTGIARVPPARQGHQGAGVSSQQGVA